MKKILVTILILLIVVILIVLHCLFGFKKEKYYDGYIPGNTYYVYKSKITGINYCKVEHGCSYVDCKNSYSYEIHLKNYFKNRHMYRSRNK